MISAVKAGAQVYDFYVLDARKLQKIGLSTNQELAKLATQLAPFGVKPCEILTDLNATGISCGDAANGFIQFGRNEFFSYNSPFDLPPSFAAKVEDPGVTKRYGSNFLATTVIGQIQTPGRAVQYHFTQRMAQFGLLLEAPNSSANAVQFIVNNQVLPAQTLTPNVPVFLAVEDSHGFTDVTIVPSGGATMSYVADHFSYLPLTQF
ncbi:MAG: hypothetical protein FIA97_05375 [Methylococcaceae bacterium]|nr:hypothetical protein [Methylococcaceae bacterium]